MTHHLSIIYGMEYATEFYEDFEAMINYARDLGLAVEMGRMSDTPNIIVILKGDFESIARYVRECHWDGIPGPAVDSMCAQITEATL